MLHAEGRQVVDEAGGGALGEHAARTVGHVLAALGLQQDAHATGGVGAREQERLAVLVDVVVAAGGVVALHGILGQETVVALLQRGSDVVGGAC